MDKGFFSSTSHATTRHRALACCPIKRSGTLALKEPEPIVERRRWGAQWFVHVGSAQLSGGLSNPPHTHTHIHIVPRCPDHTATLAHREEPAVFRGPGRSCCSKLGSLGSEPGYEGHHPPVSHQHKPQEASAQCREPARVPRLSPGLTATTGRAPSPCR